MKGFYNLTTNIEEALLADDFCRTVIYGNIFKTALQKQALYPLANFVITDGTFNGKIWTFQVELSCADIVDFAKEDTTDQFLGNDNEQDVLNTQLAVITKLLESLNRGDLHDDLYQLTGTPSIVPFTGRLEMLLAGWNVTFFVEIVSDASIC